MEEHSADPIAWRDAWLFWKPGRRIEMISKAYTRRGAIFGIARANGYDGPRTDGCISGSDQNKRWHFDVRKYRL
jgi:hypothetical protein